MSESSDLPADPLNRAGDDALDGALKDPGNGASDPLVALREGDPGPFEAYVASETGRFLGFFGRLGASRNEAEDLVQETFLKLFRLASQHATGAHYAAQGRFDAYAFRAARNVWIDRNRRRAAQPARSDQDATELSISSDARRDAAAQATPEAQLEAEEESERVRQAVSALPETHRMVFELGVVQELPYGEIAGALEIPVGTVKSRMFHAVKRVRAALGSAEADRARRTAGPGGGHGTTSRGRAS
ncbi:MAG: sigma-70 family RNA polymerase sigma factor [Planctomycetota bacterium]|nr:sigma-70 family RNA polymerase sigma factor [Planctomycetota bacterium]